MLPLERVNAPYSKWLGSEFRRLESFEVVGSALEHALAAEDFRSREDALVCAFEAVAARNNEQGLTNPVEPSVRPFHSRPFRVLGSSRFVDACVERVADPALLALPLVGSVDQLADTADLLSEPTAVGATPGLYDSWIS